MSGRSTYNRQQGGNRGAIRTQKQFTPKSSNTPPTKEPTFSTSLRRSFRTQSSEGAEAGTSSSSSIATTSRVRLAENGSWVSSRQQGGNFVAYLPQDEALVSGLGAEDGALDPEESQRVVDLLNRELSRLLKLPPRDFWREVASDASLHDFLDSFLKYRNRWYDFPHQGAKGIVTGIIVGELELSRRVFMVLYRISCNRDLGAQASDSLSAKEHEVILQEKNLLDLPKLLDICAIYGHDNEELTKLLVVNSLKAQPKIHTKLADTVSHFLSVVSTMHQRCSSSLEILLSSSSHDNIRLNADFLEVIDFVNDAVSSFAAFVNAYKPAAVYFSCPNEASYGKMDLLSSLSRLHDSLLPSLGMGFQHMFTAQVDTTQKQMISNVTHRLKMLSTRLAEFGWQLLDTCYLSDDVFQGSLPFLDSTKMFPANVEDPVIRGDILVQTFGDIQGEVSSNSQAKQGNCTFLQNVERSYKLLSRLDSLRGCGWIFMDDEQFQYLRRIIMPPSLKVVTGEPSGPPPPTNIVQIDEDAAIIESKISQIKELLPDYGKGFLSACLEAYNQNPEEVIQRILDGTLHEDLQSLDISLENSPLKSAPSLSSSDKGKRVLTEPALLPSSDMAATLGDVGGSSASGPSLTGRYTRKSKDDLPDPSTLDSRSKKEIAKTVILASQDEPQNEYEDEYDDSFDDLGLSLVDSGFEEPELMGDKINTNRGRPRGDETVTSGLNASDFNWNSRKKPQFYVKDGKNYSYKVSGSVAVGNAQEAALVRHAQKELIHGLGRGGNIALGAVKALMEADEQPEDPSDTPETVERENKTHSRGRGRRGGGSNHYRKDKAMRKHFTGLGGQ